MLLDLSGSTRDHVPADYLLHSVIIHIGMGIEGQGQSHNIAYVKEAGQWWEYDDAKRTPVRAINEHGMLPCCKQQCAMSCASMAAVC